MVCLSWVGTDDGDPNESHNFLVEPLGSSIKSKHAWLTWDDIKIQSNLMQCTALAQFERNDFWNCTTMSHDHPKLLIQSTHA